MGRGNIFDRKELKSKVYVKNIFLKVGVCVGVCVIIINENKRL